MEAIAFAASEVVRLPALELELEPLVGALSGASQHPGPTEIAVYEAGKVRKHVNAVWMCVVG